MATTSLILSPDQSVVVSQASPAVIEESLAGMKSYFDSNRWLGTNNQYQYNLLGKLHRPVQTDKHLIEYISASSILHCIDGWSYIGKALLAHLSGNCFISKHLSYYSELRATMSLLAACGIGIFNNRHYIVDSSGSCVLIPKYRGPNPRGGPDINRYLGTHEITWSVLDFWATRLARAYVEDILSYRGVNLGQYLNSFRYLARGQTVGGRWLKKWGLDIRQIANEKVSRNEASYRPNHIFPKSFLVCRDSVSFASNLWSLLEPQAVDCFGNLDKFLLRNCLEFVHHGRTLNGQVIIDADYEDRIERMLENLFPNEQVRDRMVGFFLRRNNTDDHTVIVEAGSRDSINSERHHIQVMSRALLMLRMASGVVKQLLENAGVGKDDIEFWWKPFGTGIGLWPSNNEPEDFIELWVDVQGALEGLDEWIEETNDNSDSYHDFGMTNSLNLHILSGCERAGLWGMGL